MNIRTHYMVWYARRFAMDRSLPIKFNGWQIGTGFLKKNCGHVLIMTPSWVCTISFYLSISYLLCSCLGKTYRSNLVCLITIQKRVNQILAGVHPLTHIETTFLRLELLKSIDLVDYIIGTFMYKVYHCKIPKNIWNLWYWEPQHSCPCYRTNLSYTYCPC